jgi:F-type H+-transporting ATPase subunit epsilon
MAKTFKLEIITPDRVVYASDTVESVTLPGMEGYLGILANHAPLVTGLGIGELDLRCADGSEEMVAISGGFAEVSDNKVTVLADSAELASEIDVERAERSLHRAEERLAAHTPDIDIDRAHAALARAMLRLKLARRVNK